MHYIEVYFCQQSEFGDSADSSNKLPYPNNSFLVNVCAFDWFNRHRESGTNFFGLANQL